MSQGEQCSHTDLTLTSPVPLICGTVVWADRGERLTFKNQQKFGPQLWTHCMETGVAILCEGSNVFLVSLELTHWDKIEAISCF